MLVAQATSAYGLMVALAGAIQSGLLRAEAIVGDLIDLGGKEYTLLVIAFVVLWMLTRRSRTT